MRRPASERVCDAVCAGFALFTLCAHAVVQVGGSLHALVAAYAAVLLAVGAAWRSGWRPREGEIVYAGEAAPASGRLHAVARGVGVALALGATFAFFQSTGKVVVLWGFAVGLLGVAAVLLVLREPPHVEAPARGRGLEAGLWTLGAACAVIALVCHRPDLDDAFYVNVAVTAVDHPGAPLLVGDSMHAAAELPLMLPVYRLHTWELFNAALAWLTRRPAIEVFHFGTAALAALLVPLAWARALRLLAPRDWLWVTAALVFVLVAVGETHRWYGNFAFVRMWQGKAVYLFVFLPLVYAYAIELALAPSPRGWLRLAAAQIAAVGCSSSALWGAPAAALMALCCVLRPTPADLRRFALGASASLYVLGIGWLMKRGMASGGHGPGARRLVEDYPGARLEEALGVVLHTERMLAFGLFALLAGWAFARRGLGQRFAIVLPLAVLLVLLDPYTTRWVISNVTSSSYWRVMWALPLPLLIAFVLTWPLQLERSAALLWAGRAGCVAAAVVFAVSVPRFSILSQENGGAANVGIRVGRPGLKVPEDHWRWANTLNRAAGPGATVIAPAYVGVWLPTFHQHARPLEVRESYLREYREQLGTRHIMMRHMLGRFVTGESENPKDAEVFRRALDQLDVRAVCLRRSPRMPEARRLLRQAGFRMGARAFEHEIWVRDAAGSPERRSGRSGPPTELVRPVSAIGAFGSR